MATALPSDWNVLSGGTPTMGNPADLGPYRGAIQTRGAVYDQRSNDQWDWARNQFEKNAGTADAVQKQALDTGSMFMDWSKADRKLWEDKGVPGLTSQMDYAMGYTTPERMAANRAGAMAGANISFDAAADMAKRALMGYGVDPSSGRFAGLDAGLAAKRAAAAAGAGTKSDRDTEMMGQALLDKANARFAVLPGQAANEAGVSLAAGNQAVNTGLATTASGAQTLGTGLQWAGAGDEMMKEWKDSLLKQTSLGMQQNRDAAEQRMKQAELDSKSSSGVGAALGAGMGILGTVLGGPMGGMIGSSLGSMAGGAMSGGSMFGVARKGGKIEKMRAGGMVTDVEEENEDIHRGYRPKVKDQPAREWREPVDATEWDDEELIPEDASFQQGGAVHRRQPPPRERFDPNGTGYDDETADWEGMEAAQTPDGPHGYSRVPRTGMLLKGRNHPTFDKGVEEDRRLGYGLEMRDGRYYTQPFDLNRSVQEIWGGGGTPAFAEGGEVPEDEPEFVDGGEEMGEEVPNLVPPEASPSGGEQTDDVHALLNEGEFVIPKDVTSWFGEKFFQNLIQKAYKEKQAATAQPEAATPDQQQAVALSAPTFESMGA